MKRGKQPPPPVPVPFELVFSLTHLKKAWAHVSSKHGGPGIDGVSIEKFAGNEQVNLRRLQLELLEHTYRPQPLLHFIRPKKNGGHRELGLATVRDRVAARCLADELTRRLDARLHPQCFAYRPGKGALKAVSAAQRACKRHPWVVHADIRSFFDEIDRNLLGTLLTEADLSQPLVDLILHLIAAPRFDGVDLLRPEKGIPQGLSVAPILSNFYLHQLDQQCAADSAAYIRYADDLLCFEPDSDQAAGTLGRLQQRLGDLHLRVGVDKTRVYPCAKGFLFLGFVFSPKGRRPGKQAIRRWEQMWLAEMKPEEGPDEFVKRREAMLRGWQNYFSPSEKLDVEQSNPSSTDLLTDASRGTATTELKEVDRDQALFDSARQCLATGEVMRATELLRRCLNGESVSVSLAAQSRRLLEEAYQRLGLFGSEARVADRQPPGLKTAPVYGASEVSLWKDVFGFGRGPLRKQYVDALGRCGFRPISHALRAEDLKRHWTGKGTVAVPLFGPENRVRFGVLDLDITRKTMNQLDPDRLQTTRETMLDHARHLAQLAAEAGAEGMLEDSGFKGYHLWFFLKRPVSARSMRRFLLQLVERGGPPPEGSHIELFPGADQPHEQGGGMYIKLPQGVHRASGAPCQFLHLEGQPLASGIRGLHRSRLLSGETLRRAESNWRQPGRHRQMAADEEKLTRLLKNCHVLAGLQEKAKREGHLIHVERLVVRGILDVLGESGQKSVHGIIRHCDNYDPKVTQGFLNGGRSHPLRCNRIRELLPDLAESAGCHCVFPGKKKRPLDHPLRHLECGAGNGAGSAKKKSESRLALEVQESQACNLAAANSEGTFNPPELLRRYHFQRRQLLALQEKLEALEPELDCGTLKALGPDPELRQWIIEI